MIGGKKNLGNNITALDIGTNYVKAIVATAPSEALQADGGFYVSGVGKVESRGVRKGVVINIDSTLKNIEEAVLQAEELALSKINSCILSVSGAHLESFNSNGVVKVQYNEISMKDIDRVLETAQAIPVAGNQEVLHVIPKGFVVDGQSGIKDPYGISAVRLETDVHVVTGSTNSIQSLVKCVNRNGINVQDLIVNSIASALAVTTEEERTQGVCVIDIGAGTADICVYYDGVIQHSYSLPYGGSLLTKDLAAGLRVGILSAEQLKCAHGINGNSTENIEVQSIGNQLSKIVSVNEISDILRMRLAEIFELVRLEIKKSGYDKHLTAGIVLTGGSAELAGINAFAEEAFLLPVRTGYPQNLSGLADFANSPSFATCAGMIKHNLYEQNDLKIAHNSSVKESIQRVANWLGEHF